MSQVVDIKDIVDMLTDRIEDVAAQILPRGRRDGVDWVDANVASGGLGDSMRVCLRGPRRGVFKHFSSGAGGDALDFVAYVLFSGDKKRAIAWAKSYLGLDSADPERIKQSRMKAAATRKKNEQQQKDQAQKRTAWAKKIWMEAQPIIGTPADDYLMGRNIDIRALDKVPGALRFTPSLKHKNGQFYPAMVGAIYRDGEFCAVHRTYLSIHEDGRVSKAMKGEAAKMVLGSYVGGYIALQRGKSGKSLKDAPAGDKLLLCEGIEDGLSLALACPDYRVFAAVSVNNFKNQVLPPAIDVVHMAVDNDPEFIEVNGVKKTHPARVAVQNAVDGFIDQGRQVFITRADAGKDFNDMLRGRS